MLDTPMVIEISGDDAGRIIHNLTTNHVQVLTVHQSLETFVTDVRGWVVAHGLVYRRDANCWWLVGQHPSPANVAGHIDRYIIRENAKVADVSADFQIDVAIADPESPIELNSAETVRIPFNSFESSAEMLVSPRTQPAQPATVGGQSTVGGRSWIASRIAHFWPLMGIDVWEKCIPQEIDRNDQAISFTKGCYLGQETIARLDARGQIQKKLSLLKLDGTVSVADKLLFNDQEVGHITSVANLGKWTLSLAVLRRGYFDVDTRLTCNGFAAQVIDSPCALQLLGES